MKKKSILKKWWFWIIVVYLGIGFIFYLILSINAYQTGVEKYGFFVSCWNSELTEEGDIKNCEMHKKGLDVKEIVDKGRTAYALSVSFFANPKVIIFWPIHFMILT